VAEPVDEPSSRRERARADTLREIKQTARRVLVGSGPDGLALRAIAREMGMTAPGLYRYFASRDELLAAAAAWLRDEVLQLPIEIGDEGIAASFRAAAARLKDRPRLARALLHTQTGRAVRTGYRGARLQAIRRALRREVPGLSRRDLDRAAAVLGYLCSSESWITIQDESGLDAARAQAAVVWAIESLLARLRETTTAPPAGGDR
jgi:AcrR family transcriptional regulator